MKAQSAVEIASAQKVAAVAASTAVLAGGGAAAVVTLDEPDRPQRRVATAERALPASAPTAAPSPRATAVPGQAQRREAERGRRGREAAAPGATEFDPTGNPDAPAAPTSAPPADGGGGPPQPPPDPANAEFAP